MMIMRLMVIGQYTPPTKQGVLRADKHRAQWHDDDDDIMIMRLMSSGLMKNRIFNTKMMMVMVICETQLTKTNI